MIGSRELLCLFGRISGTLTHYISLSELCFPGESVYCQIQGESVVWWSNIMFLLPRRGIFQGGSTRHVDVASSRDTTCQVVPDYRYRGSTSHVVATYQGTMPSLWLSVDEFYLRRFDPLFSFRRRVFFFHRFTVFGRHTHTLLHISVRVVTDDSDNFDG